MKISRRGEIGKQDATYSVCAYSTLCEKLVFPLPLSDEPYGGISTHGLEQLLGKMLRLSHTSHVVSSSPGCVPIGLGKSSPTSFSPGCCRLFQSNFLPCLFSLFRVTPRHPLKQLFLSFGFREQRGGGYRQ